MFLKLEKTTGSPSPFIFRSFPPSLPSSLPSSLCFQRVVSYPISPTFCASYNRTVRLLLFLTREGWLERMAGWTDEQEWSCQSPTGVCMTGGNHTIVLFLQYCGQKNCCWHKSRCNKGTGKYPGLCYFMLNPADNPLLLKHIDSWVPWTSLTADMRTSCCSDLFCF